MNPHCEALLYQTTTHLIWLLFHWMLHNDPITRLHAVKGACVRHVCGAISVVKKHVVFILGFDVDHHARLVSQSLAQLRRLNHLAVLVRDFEVEGGVGHEVIESETHGSGHIGAGDGIVQIRQITTPFVRKNFNGT